MSKYAPSAVWQIQLSKSSLAKKGGIHISVVSCTVLGIDTRNLFSSRNKPLHFGQTRLGQLYIWQFRQMEFAIWSNRGEKEWRSADRDPPLLGRPSPITPRLYISHSTFHKSENVEFAFCPYFSSQKRQILTINQCIVMINQCLFFETTNKGFLIKEA